VECPGWSNLAILSAEAIPLKLPEAVDLIEPGIPRDEGTWVELGAGRGLFTRALATLLGPGGKVVAVDRDAAAVAELRSPLPSTPGELAPIVAIESDYHDIPTIASVVGVPPDGVLLANALHFAADPAPLLAKISGWLRPGGRLVVVEYDGRPASRWVPYPVPLARLRSIAAPTGLGPPRMIGERRSAYGGIMYCAVLERDEAVR
jgi:SAM-dependent methyltransferase